MVFFRLESLNIEERQRLARLIRLILVRRRLKGSGPQLECRVQMCSSNPAQAGHQTALLEEVKEIGMSDLALSQVSPRKDWAVTFLYSGRSRSF